MTITSAHALYTTTTTGGSTLSVTATAVNDLWVVYVGVGSASVTCTGVSGGNATGWTNAVASWSDTFSINQSLWIGTMTSTGTATITATFSGSVSGLTVDIDAQPFHSSLASPVWSVDAAGHQNNASSTTVTWPTLTPSSGLTDLYWGRAGTNGTGSSPSSGYTLATDADGNLVIYNPGASGAQSPTCTQTASQSAVSAMLVSEGGVPSPFRPIYPSSSGIRRNVGPNALRHAVIQVPYSLPPAVGANAGLASAAAAALGASAGVGVNAALTSAVAAALGPTTNAGANAPAALASAVASGLGATVAIAPTAGLASASGSVPATSGGVGVSAGLASASGAAFSAQAGVGARAGLASSAVAALGSTVAAAPGAILAQATGAALAAGAGAGASAGLASAVASALSSRPGPAATAGVAQASWSAMSSQGGVGVNAGLAHAGGSSQRVIVVPLVPSPSRTAVVVRENRSVHAYAESRDAVVAPEIRTVKVPQQGG